MKVLVIYHSVYGSTLKMAKAAAEGAAGVKGAEVSLMRVPEAAPAAAIERNERMKNAQILQKGIPVAQVEDLPEYDALIVGASSVDGGMCASMKSFLDQAASLGAEGAMENRPAGVFSCGNAPHGGIESTLVLLLTPLLHLGMFIVGLPSSAAPLLKARTLSPYGAFAAVQGGRFPSEADLEVVRFLGGRVSEAAGNRRGRADA